MLNNRDSGNVLLALSIVVRQYSRNVCHNSLVFRILAKLMTDIQCNHPAKW